jgi:DNA-binding NarL/FixJ family response regulator
MPHNRSLQPDLLDHGAHHAQPRGLWARLRRLLARSKEQPHIQVDVDPQLFAHLRRAARLRRSSPQAMARELLARGLTQEARKVHTEAVLSGLTPREVEVLWRAARGHTNRQIAAALVVSPETVKTHVRNILHKLDLRSKADLRLLMLDLGLRWWQTD